MHRAPLRARLPLPPAAADCVASATPAATPNLARWARMSARDPPGNPMSDDRAILHQKKFDRLLARLQARLPARLASAVGWLISPAAILLRLPLAILFIIGGVFSF